jgi:hypothetical protein
MSMDTETSEEKILPYIDFDRFKPELICIEQRMRMICNSHRWIKYIEPYYVFHVETIGNAFFKRK